MALHFPSLPHFLSPPRPKALFPSKTHFFSLKPHIPLPSYTPSSLRLLPPSATGRFPDPSSDDPPEALEDTTHGVSKFEQIHRQASRARKLQEEDFKRNQSTYLSAIADVEDAPDNETEEGFSTYGDGDDLFGEIDKAIAMKRKEFVRQGLLKPNAKKNKVKEKEEVENLDLEEVVDLEEIEKLQGLRVVNGDEEEDVAEDGEDEEGDKDDADFDDSNEVSKNNVGSDFDSSFDFDFDSYGKNKARIVEPKFRMTLGELLDESKVVPISVYGNLEVEITGIQHDSRLVSSGDLFVCCVGRRTDGHLYLSEADKRGAVAVVASREIDIEERMCVILWFLEELILVDRVAMMDGCLCLIVLMNIGQFH